MFKIIRNEFKKFFSGKIFIFELLLIVGLCGIAVSAYKEMSEIAINNLPKAQYYAEDLKETLININGVLFAKLFLTDFIYKGYFSFFLIFTIIIAVTTFSSDRESGNMKFTLLAGADRNTLIMGKLMFLFLVIIVTVIFNIILSLAVGMIFFGVSAASEDLMALIVINFLAVLPAAAATVLTAVISQVRMNSKAVMAVGMVFAFAMGMLDTSTQTYWFSPIGALSLFPENVPVMNRTLMICSIVSAVYICVGMAVLKVISSKYEYYE